MRPRQWSLSLLIFFVSLSFLLFSKHFFSPDASEDQSVRYNGIEPSQCNVVLLADKDYFPVLQQHFRRARTKIVGTVYLFKTSSFRENEPAALLRELADASGRNVDVQIVIDVSPENRELYEANVNAGDMLKKAGVKVRYDTSNVVTHAKAFVIDDQYCFVGSHNFTHAAMANNKELSLLIDSPEMARQITRFIEQIPISKE